MNSVTGLDKNKLKGFLHNAVHDRTAMTILLSIVLVLTMGMLRPDKPRGVYQKKFWATKITWQNCADMVITGDSRALMALSPAELEKVFPDARILNYGFGANWYSQEYLEAVENMIMPDSTNKRIFMGITAHSLTDRKETQGLFLELKSYSRQTLYIDKNFAAILDFLEPMSFNDAYHGLFPDSAETRTIKHFYPDGFVGVHKIPLQRNELKNYKRLFQKRKVSDKTIKKVTDFVSKWTNEGIIVYGFQPPSCKEMVELEKNDSGFDEENFIKIFRQAGGIWIDVDKTAYESFDGSHLQDDGALQFSRYFAERVKEHENRLSINKIN